MISWSWKTAMKPCIGWHGTSHRTAILVEVLKKRNDEIGRKPLIVFALYSFTHSLTHSLTQALPAMPTGTYGSNKGRPPLHGLGQFLEGIPTVVKTHYFRLSSASSGILWPTTFASAFGCLMKCHLSDKGILLSDDMSNPPQFSPYDDDTHALLFAACNHILVNNDLRQKDAKEPFVRFLVWMVDSFLRSLWPVHKRLHRTQLR